MSYKKLIEVAMPVSTINFESEREKTARGGLPSTVHIWWSRRSMAAARSTLFASLIDDPSEHPELFPTEVEQTAERQRLLKMVEALSAVENSNNEQLLKDAHCEIIKYINGAIPTVFDPFVGGGTIPVEAHRLGLNTVSADLNAVAALITTVLTDIPSRFSDITPVHPTDSFISSDRLPGMLGLVEDVRYYGERLQVEVKKHIGHIYPTITSPETGAELQPSAWIWARTVKCPNPGCGCNIPLSSSYSLAKKKGSEVWIKPVVENGLIKFTIQHGTHIEEKGSPKVAKTAVFRCPACGEITPDVYVKECGANHQINCQLIAVVADEGKKRLYLEPTVEHEAASNVFPPRNIPHGELPRFPRRFSPVSFGITDYAELFSSRQHVYISTMFEVSKEIQNEVEMHAHKAGFSNDGISFSVGGNGATAYAQAIRIILCITISKLLDRCSNLCSWDSSGGGALRNVFSRAAMPMIWDFAEANPFANAGGSFLNTLYRSCDALIGLSGKGDSKTIVADCLAPNNVKSAIVSTDLPYYDRTSYAELSDFFYVWLKFGLSDLYPDYFFLPTSPKTEELSVFPYRCCGDKQQSEALYAEGLQLALKNISDSMSCEYPSTLSFTYKRNISATAYDDKMTEWETFITAICNAGLTITASWPLARKYEKTVELSESRGIPITLVVRRKPDNAEQTTRRFFVASVKRELATIIESLITSVDVMDLRAVIIGRALNIYTRYKMILDADGTAMRPCIASRIIEQEIDTILSLYQL